MLRLRRKKQCDWSGSDSYMMGAFNKACVPAFEAALILLIILEPLTKKVLTGHATDFFFNIVLALAASLLGVAFFLRTRHDESALDDDFEG